MKIEILGSGCAKCHETTRRVAEALKQTGQSAEVDHITDIKTIAQRGVVLTPAVAIDGQVKIAGKLPSVEEIVKLLQA